jgi:outer membrane protein TolC
VAPLVAALVLAGCAVQTEPLGTADDAARVRHDLASIFADQEPITAPITLTEAVARALKYNLDHRLKVMEKAVALRQNDVAEMSLLPQVVASAGYTGRSNYDASVSKNLTTGATGIEPTTSDDKGINSADLTMTWNILDFGISYIRARQQQDYARIVEERRRQVVHTIAQEVRSAYWRAAAAERILDRLGPLLTEVRGALGDAERLERERLGEPTAALEYQKSLLESLRQLEDIKRRMIQARTELAVLMNLHPGQRFTLAAAHAETPAEPLALPATPQDLERAALLNRAELRSQSYQLRIDHEEARVAILRMLPGISLSTGYNYSDNAFLENQAWATGGVQLTWNLMNLLSGPTGIRLAETQEDLSLVRRLALSMAVISQTHVARANFESAAHDFSLANQLAEVEGRIQGQRAAEQAASRGSALTSVQAHINALVADLRRDLSYADMQAAYGRVFATIGSDPLPTTLADNSLDAVAEAVARQFADWQRGQVLTPEQKDLLGADPLAGGEEDPALRRLPQTALQPVS